MARAPGVAERDAQVGAEVGERGDAAARAHAQRAEHERGRADEDLGAGRGREVRLVALDRRRGVLEPGEPVGDQRAEHLALSSLPVRAGNV